MSESGEERRQEGGAQDEQELASKQLKIQSKRFYIDVKENKRGRFIKLAEVGVGGRKNRILMSMQVAIDFKQQLDTFSTIHSDMGPTHGTSPSTTTTATTPPPPPVTSTTTTTTTDANTQQLPKGNKRGEGRRTTSNDQDGLIKSETLNSSIDRKRYYLDLKENQRGRFLRVSMVLNSGKRAQIAIPAQGLIEFKDELQKLLDEYSTGTSESTVAAAAVTSTTTATTTTTTTNGTQQSSSTQEEKKVLLNDADLPESKSLRADGKMFYFDCGSNQRGVFLKISEVRQNRYRTSITIPEKYLDQFQKLCLEYSEKTSSTATGATTEGVTSVNQQQ